MGIHSDACRRAFAATAVTIAGLCLAQIAGAGTRLYTGSIELRLHSGPGYSYSIPFGANFSYPKMNNLPTGDVATTVGSVPIGIRLAPNQMALKTSVFTAPPPPSWYMSYVRSYFSGGNDSASFSAGGAPGPATSSPVTSTSDSHFGVSFSGTPTQFGGTMRLLAEFSARYGFWDGAELALGAIGGSFGGKLTATGYHGGTAFPPTFFTETVWGFPWTTGTVRATAPPNPPSGGGSTPVTLTAMGSDLRTPMGMGKMQLVTPFVVRKREQRTGELLRANAGIAVVSLEFGPEPSALLQLAVGLGGLGIINRCSRRRKD